LVYTLRFFSSKCSSFHNSNVFGSCVIHILYTGCAKILKNDSGAERLITPWSTVLLEKLTGSQLVKNFPAIYGTQTVHYHIHKCPPPVHNLSQIRLVNATTIHFLKIHFNIILPSTPGSSKWFLSLRFPHQKPAHTSALPLTCYMPSHIPFFST